MFKYVGKHVKIKLSDMQYIKKKKCNTHKFKDIYKICEEGKEGTLRNKNKYLLHDYTGNR